MNRFSIKQINISNNNEFQHINPFRIKRTYNAIREQEHNNTPIAFINKQRFKQNEGKNTESLVKHNRPKISEKLKREIELYNYQKRGYNLKILPCNCDKTE